MSAIYGEAFVAGVAQELADARKAVYSSEGGMDEAVAAIPTRFSYRMQDQGVGYEAEKWGEVARLYRRLMGLALCRKPGRAEISQSAKGLGQTTKNTAKLLDSEDNETALKDLGMAKMLHCRSHYLTAGAVIGSKEFVNEAFASARDRFGP